MMFRSSPLVLNAPQCMSLMMLWCVLRMCVVVCTTTMRLPSHIGSCHAMPGSNEPTGSWLTEGTQAYDLSMAAVEGSIAGVRAVLEQGVDPNTMKLGVSSMCVCVCVPQFDVVLSYSSLY